MRLTNKISNSVKMSDDISHAVRLTNNTSASVVMNTAAVFSQWILKTGFWNDKGVWEDNAIWNDIK